MAAALLAGPCSSGGCHQLSECCDEPGAVRMWQGASMSWPCLRLQWLHSRVILLLPQGTPSKQRILPCGTA